MTLHEEIEKIIDTTVPERDYRKRFRELDQMHRLNERHFQEMFACLIHHVEELEINARATAKKK